MNRQAKEPSPAVLLRKTEYRDSDLVVQLYTRRWGKVSALARGARRSAKRFGGSLEPMHGLCVHLSPPTRGELYTVDETRIDRARLDLTRDLSRMNTASTALNWVRHAAPEGEPDAQLFASLTTLLDALDSPTDVDVALAIASFGLHLLTLLGWALDFDVCVVCGTECPPLKAGTIDPVRGGLVCRACGGARLALSSPQRRRFAAAASGVFGALLDADAERARQLVDSTLKEHAHFL